MELRCREKYHSSMNGIGHKSLLFKVLVSYLSLQLIGNRVFVNGTCYTPYYDSYCLIGLTLGEYQAHFISSEYVVAGTYDGCPYFINQEFVHNDFSIYLYWDDYYNKWKISDDYTDNAYIAYCDEYRLDNCDNGNWYHWDGTTTSVEYDMELYHCTYNNTQCLIENSNDNIERSENSYCVRNTNGKFNDIGGRYEYNGTCIEEKPVYVHEQGYVIGEYSLNSSLVIVRDEELSVWAMTGHINAVTGGASVGFVAYCKEDVLDDCNRNWYLYDGTDYVYSYDEYYDNDVIFGKCNTCIETTQYKDMLGSNEEYCIIGGASILNKFIIGRYTWAMDDGGDNPICHETMLYYVNNDNNNVTIHFDSEYEKYFINYDFIISFNNGSSHCDNASLVDCDGLWWNCDHDECALATLASGICSETVDVQCEKTDGIQIDYENGYPSDHNNFDYDFVTGIYEYYDCDENGYAMYIKCNETGNNYHHPKLIIWFDKNDIVYYISEYDDLTVRYLACHSLMAGYCTNLWYDASIDHSNNYGIEYQHITTNYIDITSCDDAWAKSNSNKLFINNSGILCMVTLLIVVLNWDLDLN